MNVNDAHTTPAHTSPTRSVFAARRGAGRTVAAVASTGLLVGMGAIGVSPALAATANDCTVDNTVTAPAGATAIQTLLTLDAPLICLSGTFTLAEPLTLGVSELTLFGLPGGATLDGKGGTRILERFGGGALSSSPLTIQNLSVVNGFSTGEDGGGAIAVERPVVLQNSRFEGNRTDGPGGAVFIASDNGYGVDAQDSTFVDNSGTDGGAIYAPGQVTSTRSVFSKNKASDRGGAIFSGTGVSGSDASTFTNNTAAADGGAIYATGSVDIVNSTFVGNRATGTTGEGGAVLARGGDISFSTFLNNTASVPLDGEDMPGEAIYLEAASDSPDLGLTANIFAGLTLRPQLGVGSLPEDLGPIGKILDGGANVFSTASEPDLSVPSSTSVFSASVTQIFGTSPQLGNNGGPTQTVALITGSPAIGIVPAEVFALATDQRGFPRPGAGSALRDAGAFELQAAEAPAPAPALAATGSAPINSVLGGFAALIVALGAAFVAAARRQRVG
jgi:predicted outer membrane repeat protein